MPEKIRKNNKKEIENRRCAQTRCSYYLQGGCKTCQDSKCHAAPYVINTSCNRCLSCENVPGALRWDDPKRPESKIGQTQEITEEQALKYLIAAATLKLMEIQQKKEQEKVIER